MSKCMVNYIRIVRDKSGSWATIDLPHEMSVSQAQAYVYDHYKGWRFSHATVEFPTADMLYVDECDAKLDDYEYSLMDDTEDDEDYDDIDDYFSTVEVQSIEEMFTHTDEEGNEVFDVEDYLEFLDELDEEWDDGDMV
jgi:hypothetical protein